LNLSEKNNPNVLVALPVLEELLLLKVQLPLETKARPKWVGSRMALQPPLLNEMAGSALVVYVRL
jgi:hypothetical protein